MHAGERDSRDCASPQLLSGRALLCVILPRIVLHVGLARSPLRADAVCSVQGVRREQQRHSVRRGVRNGCAAPARWLLTLRLALGCVLYLPASGSSHDSRHALAADLRPVTTAAALELLGVDVSSPPLSDLCKECNHGGQVNFVEFLQKVKVPTAPTHALRAEVRAEHQLCARRLALTSSNLHCVALQPAAPTRPAPGKLNIKPAPPSKPGPPAGQPGPPAGKPGPPAGKPCPPAGKPGPPAGKPGPLAGKPGPAPAPTPVDKWHSKGKGEWTPP